MPRLCRRGDASGVGQRAASSDLSAGALDLHVLHGQSYYDALIVQAAQASGCQRVLTEDMQHGARYGGVQIVNPFVD